jgi:hypothetical protein
MSWRKASNKNCKNQKRRNTIRDENLLFPAKRRSDAYKTSLPSIKPGGWASHIFKPIFARAW